MKAEQSKSVFQSSFVTFEGNLVASDSIYTADHLAFTRASVESWRYRRVKRVIDVLCALIMIAVFLIPGLLIAAVIVLTSAGSVFFREERIGRNGRVFRIWKFRSMDQHASQQHHNVVQQLGETAFHWRMRKHLQDPRITTVGNFLRRWSLDEIPQLLNVLVGEMSLIGPRPIVEAETGMYGDLLAFYLAAVPGMSGLWQVSGRSHVDYEKRAKLDALYVHSWSLRMDLIILLKTIPAVLSRRGAR
jgi:lipopolysaccharide/colanic/teichoic acid biosynthesis glycosyltransferase